jgi:hypothetical protein
MIFSIQASADHPSLVRAHWPHCRFFTPPDGKSGGRGRTSPNSEKFAMVPVQRLSEARAFASARREQLALTLPSALRSAASEVSPEANQRRFSLVV